MPKQTKYDLVFKEDRVLVNGVEVLFSPEDYDDIVKLKWRIDFYQYARAYCPIRKMDIRMHQLVMFNMREGVWQPARSNIHHKDYNKLNNRRDNLHLFAMEKQHWYFEMHVCTHPNNPWFGVKEQKECLPFDDEIPF